VILAVKNQINECGALHRIHLFGFLIDIIPYKSEYYEAFALSALQTTCFWFLNLTQHN
jgi:hypothetical protein